MKLIHSRIFADALDLPHILKSTMDLNGLPPFRTVKPPLNAPYESTVMSEKMPGLPLIHRLDGCTVCVNRPIAAYGLHFPVFTPAAPPTVDRIPV